MKRMRVEFELPEAMQERRAKLIAELKENPKISAFLNQYEANESLIDAYPSKFEQWLSDQTEMSLLSLEQLIQQPHLQTYHDLEVVNGALVEVVRHHPILLQYRQKTAYLQNFKINDMPFELQTMTFDSIDVDQETQASYLRAMQALTQYLIKKPSVGVYLFGKPGVGKSYLLACLANELAKQNKSVAYINTPSLMVRLKNGFEQYQQRRILLEQIYGVDYLFLDDIGAEQINAYNRDEVLLPILEQRLEQGKLTFFSSNYDMRQLEKVYTTDTYGKEDPIRAARILSRLNALCKPLEVSGKDRRLTALQ